MNRKLLIACLIGFISLIANNSNAQVSVNINIGAQPLWGPVGYDRVNYYYLPDIDTYYSVPARQYVYLNNGGWIFSNSLPSRYSGYNLYNGYKIVMNSPRPYRYYSTHKVKYAKYKGYKGNQPTIRYSNNPKYYVVKGHPKHSGVRSSGYAKRSTAPISKAHYSAAKSSAHGKGNGNGHGGNGQGNGKGGGGKGNGKGKH